MPRSKRAKVVHLSKVEKKGKDLSIKLFAAVQESASNHDHCFVFDVTNMRNTFLKDVRLDLAADSRLFFGKTKVMAKALGMTAEEEHLPGLSQLSKYLVGNVGLVFTNRDPAEILEYFANFSRVDYARAGIPASMTFTVPAGVVYSRGGELPVEDDVPLPHSMEPTLRQWGMPTRLEKGRVMLDQEYTVCEEGKTLNSHQTALLKLFGVATAEFTVRLKAYWSKSTEKVAEIDAMEE